MMKIKLNRSSLQKAFAEEAEGKSVENDDPFVLTINNIIVISKEFNLSIDKILNMPYARYKHIENYMIEQTKKFKEKKKD